MKKQHEIFAREMAKHGNAVKAYKSAYCKVKSDKTALTNASRLLKNATIKEAIAEESKKIATLATQAAAEELKEEIKASVLSAARKRAILRQIAEGELQIPAKKPVWDREQKKYVFVPILELPDHAARMKAIEIDNKMVGDNAPEKHLNYNTDVSGLSDDELEQELKSYGFGD